MMNTDRVMSIVAVGLFMLAATPVGAAVMYSYNGNPFTALNNSGSGTAYDTTMGVNLSLTFDSALSANLAEQILVPTSFSITDGINTIDNGNASSASFRLGTDAAGNVDSWFIYTMSDLGGGDSWYIETLNSSIFTALVWDYGRTTVGAYSNDANVRDAPGSWSVETVPAPASLWLFGSGLVTLAGYSRLRRTRH